MAYHVCDDDPMFCRLCRLERIESEIDKLRSEKDAFALQIETLKNEATSWTRSAQNMESQRDSANRQIDEQAQKYNKVLDGYIAQVFKLNQEGAQLRADLHESNRLVDSMKNVVETAVKRHKIWLADEKGDIWQADAAAKVAVSKYIGEQESVAVRQQAEKRICAHKADLSFDGLGVRPRCQLCKEWITETE